MKAMQVLDPVSNGGAEAVKAGEPYTVRVTVEGVAPLLLHAWCPEAIEANRKAPKGSKSKKEDNVESYVNRDPDGFLYVPGTYLHGALIGAARFLQDPRSPRKSAMDLFKAAMVVLEHGNLGKREWDYLDQRRVTVQRQGVNRTRPAMRTGWQASFEITVLLPEYVSREMLLKALGDAGRLIGLGDFRPTFGRFAVVQFK